jgi:hypothetical protein
MKFNIHKYSHFCTFLGLSIALLFCSSGEASAQTMSGNELLDICESRDNIAKGAYCSGYFQGAVEGLKWGAATASVLLGDGSANLDEASNAILGFCIPASVTLGQYRDVSLKYLNDHPETRHKTARILIQLALREAFPCGN